MGLALAVQRAPVPAELKFACVLAGGVASSFGLAALAARVRPIARIIGAGPPARELPRAVRSLEAARDPRLGGLAPRFRGGSLISASRS